MNKCLSIGSGCFFCLFVFFPFCFLFQNAPESRISNFLPWTCETQTSHLWKSTAVIGWPRGSQVITLTVDSVAEGAGGGGSVAEEE